MNKLIIFSKYSEPYKGGVELFTQNLIKYLKQTNKQVNLYSYYFRNEPEISKKIKPWFYFKSQPIHLDLWLKSKIKTNSTLVHNFPQPLVELQFYILQKYIPKNFILVWHANIENSRWSFFFPIYRIFIKKFLISKATTIVVSNEKLITNSTILKNVEKKKIKIIPIAAKLPPVRFIRKEVKGVINLIFIGSLRKYKGLQYLIKAMTYLNPIKFNLKICGTGEEEKFLKGLAKNLKLSNIDFVGDIAENEKITLLTRSHIFILPSINEAEAYGIVQVEALTFSTPIVNTDLSSGVPCVGDSNSSITVPVKDSSEIAKAIVQLTKDPQTFAKYNKGAYNRSKYYSEKKIKKEWQRIIIKNQ